MPACVAAMIASRPFSPLAATAFIVLRQQRLERLLGLPLADAAAPVPSRDRIANAIWKYIGCSAPQRAVVVEGGDALGSGTKSGAALRRHARDEVGDRPSSPRRRSRTAAGRAAQARPASEPERPKQDACKHSARERRMRRAPRCDAFRVAASPMVSAACRPPSQSSAACRRMTWSTLKLDGRCRGGNSLNVATNWPRWPASRRSGPRRPT